jgi:hypothetical protein
LHHRRLDARKTNATSVIDRRDSTKTPLAVAIGAKTCSALREASSHGPPRRRSNPKTLILASYADPPLPIGRHRETSSFSTSLELKSEQAVWHFLTSPITDTSKQEHQTLVVGCFGRCPLPEVAGTVRDTTERVMDPCRSRPTRHTISLLQYASRDPISECPGDHCVSMRPPQRPGRTISCLRLELAGSAYVSEAGQVYVRFEFPA